MTNNISVSDIRIQSFKLIFLKNNVAVNPDADSIKLQIFDSEGNQQGPDYTLTSTPALQYISSTKTYYIDIDVTNFAAGQIQAHWFGELDGVTFHDLTHDDKIVKCYDFEGKEPIVRIGNQVLQQPASRYYRNKENVIGPYQIVDDTNSPYSPYSVQAVVTDAYNDHTVITTITLSEVLSDELHTGIYQGVWTPTDAVLTGIYNIYVQIKELEADETYNVITEPVDITVMDRVYAASVVPAVMATVNDIKAVCTNIEEYINAKSEAYRESILLDTLQMAHDTIYNHIGAKQYSFRNPMLRQLEALYAAYMILRSDISIEPKLLQRYSDDINTMIASLQDTMGGGSERLAVFM